jgi:endonuclease/exonuclease/phosphatase family metal-dependent hydrolase
MLTISTFNIQNDYQKDTDYKTNIIINYLKDNNIDILGLQEVYKNVNNNLEKYLPSNYKMYGKYRFYSKKILSLINEKNSLITNKKVLSTKTYHLPIFPTFLKRIITKIEIEYNNEIISIYNTHLDYKYDKVKEKELKTILKILSKDKNKIILLGDFNLKTNKEIFNNFITELNKLNIKHINIGEKTYKQSLYHRAIDHIFISNSFTLLNKELITNLDISDHYPILIKIK